MPRDLPPVILGLVFEISILHSFLHSELSNKVIFPQPGLLYTVYSLHVIFENEVLFRKTDLVICHLTVNH